MFVIDEIIMVRYKKVQTMCTIKGTMDADWGEYMCTGCGRLISASPCKAMPNIYMPTNMINTLNDFAPNGWETMKLHELAQTM